MLSGSGGAPLAGVSTSMISSFICGSITARRRLRDGRECLDNDKREERAHHLVLLLNKEVIQLEARRMREECT